MEFKGGYTLRCPVGGYDKLTVVRRALIVWSTDSNAMIQEE